MTMAKTRRIGMSGNRQNRPISGQKAGIVLLHPSLTVRKPNQFVFNGLLSAPQRAKNIIIYPLN